MKRVEIPTAELGGDKYHRFNLDQKSIAALRDAGLALDSRGIPKHPWTTWYDRERGVQVFEQGERA